jgi:transcriptional antiterminator RfaH
MHWYALRVKPHKERFVNRQLSTKGTEVFFPKIRVQPKNPRAAKIRPYFPGYLFVKVDLEEMGRNAFRWQPGTYGLVSFGHIPAVVPDSLIHELKKQLAEMKAEEVQRRLFQKGDRVRIVNGPMAGYEAIFDAHLSGKDRVQVLLSFLSRHPQPTKLSRDDIVKLS